MMVILPPLPDDESFLAMLKVGGELKVGTGEVIAAMKAALATGVGLYKVPEYLQAEMEKFAEEQSLPCGEEYFEIQKLLTEKQYGDVLAVMNLTKSFVSEGKKKAFTAKINTLLWPALKSFNTSLLAWKDAWSSGMTPMAVGMMAMAGQGGGANPMLNSMMAPPDSSTVRSSGEEVVDTINKVFAGVGIPISRAMAYDATRILKFLDNPKILTQAGFASKDIMLKTLGVAVGAEIVRTEQSLSKYALAIMSLEKISPEEEGVYLMAMVQLGLSIPWDKLGNTGIGTGTQKRDLRE